MCWKGEVGVKINGIYCSSHPQLQSYFHSRQLGQWAQFTFGQSIVSNFSCCRLLQAQSQRTLIFTPTNAKLTVQALFLAFSEDRCNVSFSTVFGDLPWLWQLLRYYRSGYDISLSCCHLWVQSIWSHELEIKRWDETNLPLLIDWKCALLKGWT